MIKWRSFFFAFLCVLSWASAFVFIRIGLKGYDPGSLSLLRLLVASLGMWILFLGTSHRHKPSLRDLLVIACFGILGFGVYALALNYGEQTVSAGVAAFLISQAPVVLIVLGMIFLKERLSLKAGVGVLISMAGVGLIAWARDDHEPAALRDLLCILAALFCSAIYSVGYKRLLRRFHPIELTAYGMWAATLFLLFYLPELRVHLFQADWKTTLAVIYLGIVPSVLGYVSWSYVLHDLSSIQAAVCLYAMPLFSVLMGFALIGESPHWLALVGGLVALLGAAIVSVEGSKR